MSQKTKGSNVRFRATVQINQKGTEWEENTYGDRTAVSSIDETVIDIELSDEDLSELVDRINAHLTLVKPKESE